MRGIIAARFLAVALYGLPLIADAVISGRVVDGHGAPIPAGKVSLKLKGAQAGAVENVGATGTFSFPAISPGLYELSCEVSGFKRKTMPVKVDADSEMIDMGLVAVEVARIEEPIAIPYDPSTAPRWLKADPDATFLPIDPPSTMILAPDRRLPSCAPLTKRGRRIVSYLDLLEFFIPRSAPITKQQDIDYIEYSVFFGQKQNSLWLRLMFGPSVGGGFDHEPASSIQWIKTQWMCPEVRGTNLSGKSQDGRRWRVLSFASGYASYEGLPPDAADYFDKILDTACCGNCTICR